MKSVTERFLEQHGAKIAGVLGKEATATCPLCGKERHLYVDIDKFLWSCKHCGKEGNRSGMLRELSSKYCGAFTAKHRKELAQERGVPEAALSDLLGYNEMTSTYMLTVPTTNGGIFDIRQYRLGRKLISSAGAESALWGWELLAQEEESSVWICEGEWDAMVLRWSLRAARRKGIVLSAPGAGVFKQSWPQLLDGRIVNVVYDNDDAGMAGMKRVYNLLRGIAKETHFIHWEKNRPEGFDVRDLYKLERSPRRVVFVLGELMQPVPPGVDPKEEDKKVQLQLGMFTGKLDGPGADVGEVYAEFDRWLHLPDKTYLDVLYGTAIANRISGDPIWMLIIAEPGGTKTEPLVSLSHAPNVVTVSQITPTALVSGSTGAGGGDPSLLARFHGTHGRMLVIKDLTSLLSLDDGDIKRTFGILREIYDGKYERPFGNGLFRRYVTRFGIIAAVTPEIERYLGQFSSLGERFLSYRVAIPRSFKEQRVYLRRAQRHVIDGEDEKMRDALAAISRKVLDHSFTDSPSISEKYDEQLQAIAYVTSALRGSIPRDRYTKSATGLPCRELGTRLVKEFTKFVMGVGQFRRSKMVGKDEMFAARRVALHSAPALVTAAMRVLYDGDGRLWKAGEVCDRLRMPENSHVKLTLDTCVALGIAQQDNSKNFRLTQYYSINDDFLEVLKESEVFDE